MKSASKSQPANNNISPVGKKLIQARLPFKTVTATLTPTSSSTSKTTTTTTTSPSSKSSPRKSKVNSKSADDEPPPQSPSVDSAKPTDDLPRKRKLSVTSPSVSVGRLAKVTRTESKENVAVTTVVLDSSDEGDDDAPQPPKTPNASAVAATATGNGRKSTGSASAKKTPKAATGKTPKSGRKTSPQRKTPRSANKQARKRKASSPVVDSDPGVDDVVVVLDDTSCSSAIATDASNAGASVEAAPATPKFAIKLPAPKKRNIVAADSPLRKSPRKCKEAKSPAITPAKTTAKTPAKTSAKTPAKSPAKTPANTPVKTPAKTPANTPTNQRSRRSLPEKPTPADVDVDDDEQDATPLYVHSSGEDAADVRSDCDADDKELSDDENTNASSKSTTKLTPKSSVRIPAATTSSTAPSTPAAASIAIANAASDAGLTPKQLQRRHQKEERERKLNEEKLLRQEKRKELDEQRRLERERRRLEELEEKRRKEEQRDEERRKREGQKEEERRKRDEQKEEERRKREEQKDEERRKREELKEEERRKKDDERLAKEEAEKKKKEKSLAVFNKFFTARKDSGANSSVIGDEVGNGVDAAAAASSAGHAADVHQNFMPFRVKEDMKLAPLVRRVFSVRNRDSFDDRVLRADGDDVLERDALYLAELRGGRVRRGTDGRTWTQAEVDVQIIDDELEGAAAVIEEPTAKQTFRAKFFKFTENRRPPFYGTWRRRSTAITARKPFVQDTVHFDYECDSDDEWEEEEPGESLHGSDDDKDKDESDVDEYDIDNKFFVPHGHLSDEEVDGAEDGDEDDDNDDADDEGDAGAKREPGAELDDNSPAVQKAKLKIIQMQFAHDMKKKTEKIKPRLVGCVWQRPDGGKPDACATIIWDMLNARAAFFDGATVRPEAPAEQASGACGGGVAGDGADSCDVSHKRVLGAEDVADLIRLLHGNRKARAFLQKEFLAFLAQKYAAIAVYRPVSNNAVGTMVGQLARYRKCPDDGEWHGKLCWYVPAETREKYGVGEVRMPNEWTYTLKVPKKAAVEVEPAIVTADTASNDALSGTQTATATASQEEPKSAKKSAASKFSISQFTRVLSDEEKRKQFETVGDEVGPANGSAEAGTKLAARKRATLITVKPAAGSKDATNQANAAAATQQPVVRKRVSLLASGPLNEEIPAATRNALISSFLSKSSTKLPAQPSTSTSASSVSSSVSSSTDVAASSNNANTAIETVVLD